MDVKSTYGDQNHLFDQTVNMYISAAKLDILKWSSRLILFWSQPLVFNWETATTALDSARKVESCPWVEQKVEIPLFKYSKTDTMFSLNVNDFSLHTEQLITMLLFWVSDLKEMYYDMIFIHKLNQFR